MFPWYQVLPPDFELPEDDKRGIQYLYGAKEEKMWAKVRDKETRCAAVEDVRG